MTLLTVAAALRNGCSGEHAWSAWALRGLHVQRNSQVYTLYHISMGGLLYIVAPLYICMEGLLYIVAPRYICMEGLLYIVAPPYCPLA